MLTKKQEDQVRDQIEYLFAAIETNNQLLDDDMRDQEEIVDEYLEVIKTILKI